jgi:hypothetical protein
MTQTQDLTELQKARLEDPRLTDARATEQQKVFDNAAKNAAIKETIRSGDIGTLADALLTDDPQTPKTDPSPDNPGGGGNGGEGKEETDTDKGGEETKELETTAGSI